MMTMKLSVLVLCAVIVLPTAVSQNVECIPLVIDASVLNCSAIDSLYLSCACNVYRASIVELVSTISCLLPTSVSTSALQSQVSQLFDMTTPKMDVINVKESVSFLAAPAALEQSSTANTFQLLELILNITDQVGGDIFDRLCANAAQLSQCADAAFMNSAKVDDMNLKALFNMDQIGTFISSMCGLKNDLYANAYCNSDLLLSIGVCAYLPMAVAQSSVTLPILSGTLITDVQVQSFCPVMGDFFRCVAIQVAPCSSSLATMVESLSTSLLTTTCSDLAVAGTQYITSSPLLVCAVRHFTKAIPLVLTIESFPDDPSTYQIQTFVLDAINLVCGILPDYFSCIAEELPLSRNKIDVFVRTLVDVTQFTHSQAITDLICNADRITAMKNMLPCVMTKAPLIESCGTPERIMVFENFNLSSIGYNATKDRLEFCGPIEGLAMCIFDTVLVPCDADVGAFAKETFHWAMQTDCNGARNGSYQNVIDQQNQKQNGASVPLGNAPIYWLGILLASVLMFWV